MTPLDLLQEVKAATRHQHERLETVLPLNSESMTLEGYREVLGVFLGVFESIEKALTRSGLPDEIEFDRRKRTALLEGDLRHLGLSESEIREIPRWSGPSHFPSVAWSLGVLYVLEGSRFGGQYLTKSLHDRFGLSQEEGCSFFSSRGFEVGAMWNKFCRVARDTVTTTTDREDFLEGAKSTFSSFETWVASRHVPIP